MAVFKRLRTRGSGQVAYQQFERNNSAPQCKDGPWSVDAVGTFSKVLLQREAVSDDFPYGPYHEGDFKIGRVARSRVSQSASQVSWSLPQPSCTNGTKSTRGSGTYVWPLRFSAVTDVPSIPDPSISDINNLCRGALASVNGSDIGVSETLAELGATLRMLRKPLAGIQDLLKRAASRKTKRGWQLKSLEDASSAWLEYRYGWTPLVMTVADLLNGIKYFPDTIYDAKASMTTSSSSTLSTTEGKIPTWSIYLGASGQTTTTMRKTGRVYYQITDINSFKRLKLGLDVLNIPSLAYELTRLSFAVDWWFALGDYIAALTPNPYVRILGYTYSEKRTTNSVSQLQYVRGYDGIKHFAAGLFSEEKETYYRNVVTPNVTALPTLDLDLHSVNHAIDALGLIIQSVPLRRTKRKP